MLEALRFVCTSLRQKAFTLLTAVPPSPSTRLPSERENPCPPFLASHRPRNALAQLRGKDSVPLAGSLLSPISGLSYVGGLPRNPALEIFIFLARLGGLLCPWPMWSPFGSFLLTRAGKKVGRSGNVETSAEIASPARSIFNRAPFSFLCFGSLVPSRFLTQGYPLGARSSFASPPSSSVFRPRSAVPGHHALGG